MSNEYITAADMKRYAWCPRILYYTHVLHLEEKVTDAMEMGKEEHDESILAPVIAMLKGKRVIREPFLVSEYLRISGKPDYIIETRFGEFIPVEIKYASAKYAKKDHKIQLAIYALLIEEEYNKIVKRAVVYYLLSRKIMKIDITSDLKRSAISSIDKAYKIIENEEFPKVKQPRSKCVNCGYFRYCYPLI